jgi:uncharacterized ferritin-like protein (DUF455 family)
LTSLFAHALAVLKAADPAQKVALTHEAARRWRAGALDLTPAPAPPERPARPSRPELRPPRDMPRRRIGGIAGRVALLHALAHIEMNAIDLAWDLLARFAPGNGTPRRFIDDWVNVADDEARHFAQLGDRLATLGSHYGALPAHDGLWQAALDTADDLLARLAIVPLVLEARGLDVTPATAARLEQAGDEASASLLEGIYHDEIRHVAAGWRWFEAACVAAGHDPVSHFHHLVATRFKGRLKGPFNVPARRLAGLPTRLLSPVCGDCAI